MSRLITPQMMSDLPYTCENQAPSKKITDSKSINKNLRIFRFNPKSYDASAILGKISEHLDALARIESEENHVPLVQAKETFARAIALQPTTLIHDLIAEYALMPIVWVSRNSKISSLIIDVIFRILCEHPHICLNVHARRERLVRYLAKILDWQTGHDSEANFGVKERQFNGDCSMFVFRSSDVEAAIDCLSLSIANPSGENRIKEVYVQESVLDDFKTKLQRKLPYYSSEVLSDPLLQQMHEELVKILKKLNALTIRPLNASENDVTPVVCYEFDLSYFPPNFPVVVLKVFRTVSEAVCLAKKNTIPNASIWTENLALAYELVDRLDRRHFWINCFGVSCKMWTELSMFLKHKDEEVVFEKLGNSGVRMENSYHFEYFQVKDAPKFVAFPFGTTFAN